MLICVESRWPRPRRLPDCSTDVRPANAGTHWVQWAPVFTGVTRGAKAARLHNLTTVICALEGLSVLLRVTKLFTCAVLVAATAACSTGSSPAARNAPSGAGGGLGARAVLLGRLAELQALAGRAPVDIASEKLFEARVRVQATVNELGLHDDPDWKILDESIGTVLAHQQALRDVASATARLEAADSMNMELTELLVVAYREQRGHAREMAVAITLGMMTQRLMKNIESMRVATPGPEGLFIVGKDASSLRDMAGALLKGGFGLKPAKGEARAVLQQLQDSLAKMSDDVALIMDKVQLRADVEEAHARLLQSNANLIRNTGLLFQR